MDVSYLWPAMARLFYKIEREQFETEGGRAHAWVQAKAAYARRKAREGHPQLLQRSGRLKSGLTGQGIGTIFESYSKTLRLGTATPYARYLQTGTRGMPARPPVDLTEEDKLAFREIAKQGIAKFAREAGFGTSSFGL